MLAHLDLRFLFRVILPFVLLPVLGVAPRAHDLTRRLHHVRQASQPARAADELAWIAKFEPWRNELWELAGLSALQGDLPQVAIAYLERARGVRLLSPEAYLSLGDAYQQIGNRLAAQTTWQAALDQGASAQEVYKRLLTIHRAEADDAAIIADLQALTALNPADGELHYLLGLYLATQQPEAALAHLAQAAEINQGLKPKAEALLRAITSARRADDVAYTFLEVGRALAALGEWELAEEAFLQAAEQRPDYADAWAYLGEARQQNLPRGEALADQGLAELDRALSLDARSLAANTFMALYWQRRAEYARALEVMQAITRIYPDNPVLQAELGRALALTGDLPGALRAYQRAATLAPRNPDYWRLLADFCVRHEYQVRQVALPAARQAAALDPNDPANLDMLGQVLLLLQDLTSAERAFQRALDVDANYSPAHVHLGLALILREEHAQAYSRWEQVVQKDPHSPAAEQARRLLQNYFP